MKIRLLTYLLLPILLSCCSEDDNTYPSLHTELAEVYTGSDKNVKNIVFDDGRSYDADRVISSSVADTLLRCVCSYSIDDSYNPESFKTYSLSTIPSSFPTAYDSFKSHSSVPVKVLGLWETKRYINAYISYKTTDKGKHTFSFSEDSIVSSIDGVKTAFVSLHHENPNNDPESYTQHIYISFPKYYYEGKTDKVELTINQ